MYPLCSFHYLSTNMNNIISLSLSEFGLLPVSATPDHPGTRPATHVSTLVEHCSLSLTAELYSKSEK